MAKAKAKNVIAPEAEVEIPKELSLIVNPVTPLAFNGNFAEVKATGIITPQVARDALKLEGVDDAGLDDLDRNFLSTIIRVYNGGPVGVEALSATLNEEVDTLVDMVEPYLLQQGFISRTKAGRKANEPAYKHLKLKPPARVPPSLFE